MSAPIERLIGAHVRCGKCGVQGVGNCDCYDFRKGQTVSLTSDEAKAMNQLVSCWADYPNATGLSHLMALLIRDARQLRAVPTPEASHE